MAAQTNIAQVCVDGDLDVRSAPKVRAWIDGLVDSGCRRVVLNMANASYADSAGFGMILREMRRMREVGGILSLTNVKDRVYRSLVVMRMADLVPITRAGASCEVPDLPAGALPEWRTTFRVDAGGLEQARGRLHSLIAGLPLSNDDIFDMNLASGEALGNAVDHTCAEGVLVTVAAYADRVVIDVADCGKGFLPDGCDCAGGGRAAAEPEGDSFAERGRGIKLMRLLADSVTIGPKTSGSGTVVRLVKMYSARPADAERLSSSVG